MSNKFQISEHVLSFREQIYSSVVNIYESPKRNANIFITYHNNKPISSSISHIIYDTNKEYKVNTMINSLLKYIHKIIHSIKEIYFEDNMTIDNIPFYYLSIAFNGETWYEKYFNARHKNANKHIEYKSKINDLLYSEETKTTTTFLEFLEIATPPIKIIVQLEEYYTFSKTFDEFFQSIPEIDRNTEWIITFMKYHMKHFFVNTDWMIELPVCIERYKKNTRKYYCPKGYFRHSKPYIDIGIDMEHV